jgi:hypothetical protein
MAKTKTYSNSIPLAEDFWKYSSKESKIKLLNILNYDESFADTKSIKELVNHGGGMVASSLKNLCQEWLNRSGGKVTITWS